MEETARYALDGASKWIADRVDALKGKNDQLASNLTALKQKIDKVNEQLDTNAHNFVTSLNKIHDLLQVSRPNDMVTNLMIDNC